MALIVEDIASIIAQLWSQLNTEQRAEIRAIYNAVKDQLEEEIPEGPSPVEEEPEEPTQEAQKPLSEELQKTGGYAWYGIPTGEAEIRMYTKNLNQLIPIYPISIAEYPSEAEILTAIRNPKNVTYLHVTHGCANRIGVYKGSSMVAQLTMEEVRSALMDRSPFRFTVLKHCYADMTPQIIENGKVTGYAPPWPWVFAKSFKSESVVITSAGYLNEGAEQYKTPPKQMTDYTAFFMLIGDPTNLHTPLYQLWKKAAWPCSPRRGPSLEMRFWGSHEMTPQGIFREKSQ